MPSTTTITSDTDTRLTHGPLKLVISVTTRPARMSKAWLTNGCATWGKRFCITVLTTLA